MESATCLFILTLLTTIVGKTVHYTDRNLTQVPIDAITPDVYSVKLSNNKISHLDSFNSTPYIRYLFIDNNRVNNLFPQTFQRLDKLRILDLDRNYIVILRDFIFSDLSALLDLFLSNNLISAVSERAFYGLASLEFLELSGNRLSSVPMQAIKLISSKQLLSVLLRVNNISHIPQDLKSAHPSTTYQLQGNPLHCSDAQGSHDDEFNIANMDKWPIITPYIINTEHNRTFVERHFLLKSHYKNFAVVPTTFYATDHISFLLPFFIYDDLVDSFFWNTPTGRHLVKPATKPFVVEDFTAEDSGMYTNEASRQGSTNTFYSDLLLCLIHRLKETKEKNTTMSPSDDFLQQRKNNTDTCSGSTNQSCCSYWLVFKSSFYKKFCVDGNTNSGEKHIVLALALLGLFSLGVLSHIALFRWRKQQPRREHISTASTTLHIGVQAMAVCIPHHNLLELTDHSREEESSQNTFPLRRLRSIEVNRSAMTMGATQYTSSFRCVAEARQADTDGTTEAQVHHYDNDDASDADEEEQYHQYASAAPPPLPVYEDTASKVLVEEESDQPAFHVGSTETGEEEMPYGVAAANSLYQRDTAPNHRGLTSEHACSSSSNNCAIEGNQMEESFHVVAEANSLYHQDATANRRTLTGEHACNASANYCAIEGNQLEESFHVAAEANTLYHQNTTANFTTFTREYAGRTTAYDSAADPIQTETVVTAMYIQQTAITRDVTITSNRESVEDFGILYGSGAATVE
uniref:LRRCT domain-containing protein n=1 Tax=Branchiostoma floridae TaxID=7739 RepID=C3ZS81_BRAFL|eukprot:XP_002588602.1 hypothetical protein BRAFLDRAFT_107517 [Branchiostoma floridae]